jgi:hypothetical protein
MQPRPYVGQEKDIPSFRGASGEAKLTYYCVYVQAAPYLTLGLDGGWKEVPGSRTCGSATGFYSDHTILGYSGLKFRICRAKPLASDPCGDVVKIAG